MRLADLNFFLVGAARSGTTAMWDMLRRTPGVYMTSPLLHKEPGYFSELTGMRSLGRYLDLFEGANPDEHRAIGEASTAYLTDAAAPARIARATSKPRLLVMLRNPVDRAYSMYHWMVQEGYEPAATFREALRREPVRQADEGFRTDNPQYFHNYMYVGSGRYADQIERLRRHVPEERILVVLFEDFVASPGAVYEQVLNFLGVPPVSPPPEPRTRNPSRRPRHPLLQYVLRRVTGQINRLRRSPPASKAARDFLLEWGLTRRAPEPLPPDLRRRLAAAYRDDVERLERLLDRDLSSWKAAP